MATGLASIGREGMMSTLFSLKRGILLTLCRELFPQLNRWGEGEGKSVTNVYLLLYEAQRRVYVLVTDSHPQHILLNLPILKLVATFR